MPWRVKDGSLAWIEDPKPIARRCIDWVATQVHRPPQPCSHISAPNSEDNLQIVCISDTHTTKQDLPAGDILIHAGDLSSRGTFDEVQEQLMWLNSQPHEHKIVIGGNHDIILDNDAVKRKSEVLPRDFPSDGKGIKDLEWGSLHYLVAESVTLTVGAFRRRIKVFGSPYTPAYGDWAFQYPPVRDIWQDQIPDDTDIVVTHGPPRGHMDPGHFGKIAGCPHLLREIRRVRPKLHVFGHIHEGRGQEVLKTDAMTVAYEAITEHGDGLGGLCRLLSVRFTNEKEPGKQTLLVNAAVMQKPPYTVALPATVVTI